MRELDGSKVSACQLRESRRSRECYRDAPHARSTQALVWQEEVEAACWLERWEGSPRWRLDGAVRHRIHATNLSNPAVKALIRTGLATLSLRPVPSASPDSYEYDSARCAAVRRARRRSPPARAPVGRPFSEFGAPFSGTGVPFCDNGVPFFDKRGALFEKRGAILGKRGAILKNGAANTLIGCHFQ